MPPPLNVKDQPLPHHAFIGGRHHGKVGVQAGTELGPDYTKKGVKRNGRSRLWTGLHTMQWVGDARSGPGMTGEDGTGHDGRGRF